MAASAAAALVPLMGTGVASADTHTGYVIELTCNGVTTTYVTPTSPAAAAQDVSSTAVAVLAYGAYLVPGHFPAGKVIYCDLNNITTGNSYTDLPFLVVGAPQPSAIYNGRYRPLPRLGEQPDDALSYGQLLIGLRRKTVIVGVARRYHGMMRW